MDLTFIIPIGISLFRQQDGIFAVDKVCSNQTFRHYPVIICQMVTFPVNRELPIFFRKIEHQYRNYGLPLYVYSPFVLV